MHSVSDRFQAVYLGTLMQQEENNKVVNFAKFSHTTVSRWCSETELYVHMK